jgi:N-acetylmuramoyl-L-alanine amidase
LALGLAVLIALAAGAPAVRAAGPGEGQTPLQVFWANGRIVVGIYPQPNEGYIQIARRVMEHPERHAELRTFNGDRPVMAGITVKVPLVSLKPALRGTALLALYPDDEMTEEGWAHTVADPLESLIQLAESFTGSKRYFRELARRNRLKDADVLRLGTQIIIPLEWIPDELGLRPPGLKPPLKLEKDAKSGRDFALYTLRRDDTLYSLVLQFTDREQADEVNRLSGLLVKLNSLRGAERIRAGRTIRIPLEWIGADWVVSRPAPPQRVEVEPELRRPPAPKAPPKPPAGKAPPPPALAKRPPRGAPPVYVILDPGHGGVDPGAVYGSRRRGDLVYEHEVVFDIALRARQVLEAQGHKVFMTVGDPRQSQPVDVLNMKNLGKEEVLVSPPFRMNSVTVSVNLRVYLIDTIYTRLTEEEGVAPENIVLISLHGDALAPTLRGTMIYFPDFRLRTPEFGPRGRPYRAREEGRAHLIRYDPAENRMAHDMSRGFADLAIHALDAQGVRVSTRKAVRPFYYRHGVRTLPAVLRYSRVPNSVLVEIANLNNPEDRREMLQAAARQRVARGLADSIEAFRARQGAIALSKRGG